MPNDLLAPLRQAAVFARRIATVAQEAAAAEDRRACAAAQVTAQQHGLAMDPDEALVWERHTDAVAWAGPREDRVIVRASILLGYGADPAAVCEALATWVMRWPSQVGTAPQVP